MRMIALSDFDPGPGRLVEWRVTASSAPRPHRAPASSNQWSHLTARSGRAPSARAPRWYAASLDLQGRMNLDALGTALRSFVARHDTLRSGFDPVGGGLRRWLLPPAAVATRPTDAGTYTSGRQAVARLGRIFDDRTDPARWPAYTFAAVLRQEGCTLLMAFDHSVTDLYSLALAVDEIRELYAAASDGLPPAVPSAGSFLAHCAEEAADVSRERVAAAAAAWHDMLGPGDSPAVCFPVDLGKPDGDLTPLQAEEFPLADAAGADRLERRCRRSGSGFLAGLLAALALCSGAERFRTIIPVHTRDDRTKASMGWFVNGLPIAFDVPYGRDFDPVLARADAAVRTALPHRSVPADKVLAQLRHPALDRPASWLSYVDYRGFAGSAQHERARAHILTCSRSGAGVDMWVSRTSSGLFAHVRYPATDTARKSVRTYVTSFASVIAEAGGDTAPLDHGHGVGAQALELVLKPVREHDST
ncbi:condensation domain-containing protein [Streptomyces triticiradicis]|uniref:Condensation domain-containing protein n=1 Tax=Streptomyces triticiradicis TaxID=2651189 RepID=A0A7J5DPP8_9ACTN|nr:condensation domain-containing protein [Streptomyces triticiradicis]KAB1990764.1 hypothetical protein F8144_02255 [Streptomyces triticiradicis]